MDKKITLQGGKEVQVFNQTDFVDALQKKYPYAMTLCVNGITPAKLYEYLTNGTMGGKDFVQVSLGGKNDPYGVLDCRLNLSPSLYGHVNVVGENRNRFLISKELVKAGLEEHIEETAYMDAFPELDGGQATVSISLLPRMTIQGKYLYETLALMLQVGEAGREIPSSVLADYLTDGKYREQLKEQGDRMWNIPPLKKTDEVLLGRNKDRMYIYQKGVLGFAQVRPSRDYEFYGELPDERVRDLIRKVVAERNERVWLPDNNCKPFFVNPSEKCPVRQCFNPARNIVVPVTVQKTMDEKDMYVVDNTVIPESVFKNNYIDVTGRITDITVTGGNRIACSVDGKRMEERTFDRTQGMGRVFTGLENRVDNTPELKERLYYSLAAQTFRDVILEEKEKLSQKTGMPEDAERITHIKCINRSDGAFFIRCKVDGVQQGFERLNAKDARIMDYYSKFPVDSVAYKEQLLFFAQKYFKFVLHESQEQKMTRSM